MSAVAISVEKYFDGVNEGPGALVSVIPVADAAGKPLDGPAKLARRRDDLVVPMSMHGQGVTIDLPPGEYVARVTLPSGRALESEFAVVDDKPASVVVEAGDSPHEWLSWHHFGGSTTATPSEVLLSRPTERAAASIAGGAPAFRAKAARPTTAQADVRFGFTAFQVGEDATGPFSKGALWHALLNGAGSYDKSWQTLGNRASAACWGDRMDRSDEEDAEFILFRTSLRDARWMGRADRSWRNYFVARTNQAIEIATLPLPWERTEQMPAWVVELLIRRTAPPDTFLTRTTVADTRGGAMISYMSQRRLDLARPFFKQARDYLVEKLFNPLGAAAGAYVLLTTATSDSEPSWNDWTRNLANWFKWLPDGAVLRGISMLRKGQSDAEFREAQDWLLEGFARGVPYYSLGVLLLQEGLLQLASEWKEPATVRALETVNRVAAALDVSQPFTTLRFTRKT